MITNSKAAAFAALHVASNPLILFNAWDPGSAKAVAEAGARAIATGSWSVAAAHGLPDGEAIPIEIALDNAKRIAEAVDLPETVDFEGGYATEPAEIAANFERLVATGAIGCNFEDQVVGDSGLYPADVQARRIAAARTAAGDDFFINARTDVFLQAPAEAHDRAKIDEAVERARAYADAGARGFFAPGLVDLGLIGSLCAASPLPVNIMSFPGVPSNAELAGAGVARISYGPVPYNIAMQALTAAAREVYG
jgi:2-methylisocitrate lyase-like PEP mutase family enzyme